MKKILGFDCSSTTIGYCVLKWDEISNQISFVSADYFKPPKDGNLIERIAQTRDAIREIIENVKPDFIGVEEIISFMKGKSTAQTIIMLTTFNRMICLLAYDWLGKSPELFNVMSIRHGLKMSKELPPKENMPELCCKHLGIPLVWEKSKKGKIKTENYDRFDGVAVALYYAFVLSGKIIRKIKKPKTKTKQKKKAK
jgi:hypothetical protein